LPSYERINPSYLSNINRAAELAAEADEFIDECAEKFISAGVFDKSAFTALHPAVLKRALCTMYENECGEALNEVHLSAVTDFIPSAENGQRLELPKSTDFICENGQFRFIKRVLRLNYCIKLVPGENDIRIKKCKIFVENVNSAPKTDAYRNIYKIVKRIKISSDIIKNGVFVRNRAEGDSIKYGGMTHSVKKILSEKKIPSSLRPDYPVICDKDGPLAVPPFAIRDGCEGDGAIYLTYCEY
jgi:tRNA(Ile)-lysidine synthetase-like protein